MRQIILFAIGCLSCCTATAQTMTLQDCFKLADNNNISLQAAKIGVDKARLMEGTAWDIDKTELTLSQDPTSGASPDNSLSLSQSIDFPTRYVARRHQLKAETNARQSQVAVINNQLHGQIASLYYQLVYEQERIHILEKQDTMLSHYKYIATKRHNAGEVRQLEPLNANRLLHENQLALNMAKTEYANTQTELARLLGSNVKVEPLQQDLLPIAYDKGDGYNYTQTPEGQMADAQLRVADKVVKAEKSAYAPSLTVALRTQMVIKGWNPYHVDRAWNDGNFMGFEVGVGIPLFNGSTRARVKAAKKEREQLNLQVKDDAQIRESEYIAATNNMLAARGQLDYYKNTGHDDAVKTSNISALAYENGEISYIEYMSALQQSIDTQLKYATSINDYNQAVIKLKTLCGSLK